MESWWALVKQTYHGTYSHLSSKYQVRCVQEFAGFPDLRDLGTVQVMGAIVQLMTGKRNTYAELINIR